MTRGDVYWAVLVPRSGSEQQGRRPVIVVSHDGFNQTPGWRSVIYETNLQPMDASRILDDVFFGTRVEINQMSMLLEE
jgi:(2Fe-2S) ferredoxin